MEALDEVHPGYDFKTHKVHQQCTIVHDSYTVSH